MRFLQRSTPFFLLAAFFMFCASDLLWSQTLCLKKSFVASGSASPLFSNAYGSSPSCSFDAAYFCLDSVVSKRDTLAPAPAADTLAPARDTTLKYRLDPGFVALGAAALPGFGQIYNRSYWKLPIVYGVIGWFVFNYFRQNNQYLFWQRRYSDSLAVAQAANRPPTPELTAYRSFRESFRESRDEYGVYILLAYLLSIVDAYIDAHLFGFEVSDDLASRAAPASGVPIFSIKLKF